jgi:hypothetical protein
METIVPARKDWVAAYEAGSWSPAYGAAIPAPILHFSREGPLPAECVTFLALNPPGRVFFCSVRADGANVYLATVGESRRLVVLAERPGIWHFETIESEAELLVLEYSALTIRRVLISGGSEVRIGGEALALERKVDGVWEGVANPTRAALLSPARATALLEVLERLGDKLPVSVSSELRGTGHSR